MVTARCIKGLTCGGVSASLGAGGRIRSARACRNSPQNHHPKLWLNHVRCQPGAAKEITNIMQPTLTLNRMVAHPYFALACFMSVLVILPRYGGTAVMVGCASVLSAYVWAAPECFRSRNGSMILARCLITGLWCAAAGIAAWTWLGGLRD